MEGTRRDFCGRTFAFSVRIVDVCTRLGGKPGPGRTLGKQLLRAGTSIGANVEEAQGGQSRADFISKYSIARKEAREAHCWLRLLAATGLETEAELAPLIQECGEFTAILTAIIKKAQSNKDQTRRLASYSSLCPSSFTMHYTPSQ